MAVKDAVVVGVFWVGVAGVVTDAVVVVSSVSLVAVSSVNDAVSVGIWGVDVGA